MSSVTLPFQAHRTTLPDVLVIDPVVFGDHRGYFLEVWSREHYRGLGLPAAFAQDNVSRSDRGVLRGLHLQHPFAQGKLVHVLDGEIFDVAVDVRVASPTFGRWVGERLSGRNHRQLYIPPGFAHGFCVLSASALVAYKATEPYHPEAELGIAWNDPALNIDWPLAVPVLSPKDAAAPRLADVPLARLPRFER
ncbi:MAG: dTDP-4-dehydrorhamnose 3,5-epimerase [Vicinamibacterales bacterium]